MSTFHPIRFSDKIMNNWFITTMNDHYKAIDIDQVHFCPFCKAPVILWEFFLDQSGQGFKKTATVCTKTARMLGVNAYALGYRAQPLPNDQGVEVSDRFRIRQLHNGCEGFEQQAAEVINGRDLKALVINAYLIHWRDCGADPSEPVRPGPLILLPSHHVPPLKIAS